MKYDLHTHLFTTWNRGRLSLDRSTRDPEKIIDAIVLSGIDGIVLINFEDSKYEEFAHSALETEGKYKIVRELRNAIIFSDGTGEYSVIRGQEIPAAEGHVLALGIEKHVLVQSGMKLEKTLLQALSLDAATVAAHPINHVGIGTENLKQNSGLFTAYEMFNANFRPFEIDGRSDCSVAGISVSDSHNLKDLGNGYIECKKFDFSSEENLRGSIKETISRREFEPVLARRNPFASRAGHVINIVYDRLRRKVGLL